MDLLGKRRKQKGASCSVFSRFRDAVAIGAITQDMGVEVPAFPVEIGRGAVPMSQFVVKEKKRVDDVLRQTDRSAFFSATFPGAPADPLSFPRPRFRQVFATCLRAACRPPGFGLILVP